MATNIFSSLLYDSNSLYQPLGSYSSNVGASVAPATKMNLTAVVFASDGETLPAANISVNGVPKTQTNSNGVFTLYNILSTDSIKVTYIGQKDYEVKALDFPNSIEMRESAEGLKEVIITAAKKPTNWLLWLGIGTVGFLAYQKYGAKAPIKAKL